MSGSAPGTSFELDSDVAHHLATSYGDRATLVLQLAQKHGLGKKLIQHLPVIEAEVVYAIQVGDY